MPSGTVYLIGAGPGDPGLFTLRGREILSQADIIVYDRLVHPDLLRFARSGAEKVYVGKQSARHALPQNEINQLLISSALAGKMVARLKGGDPFVFGRGGEEAECCREAKVLFEIVPGVTSAIAAPAYAGIPITHRDAASSFCVITGHERDDRRESGGREGGKAEGRRDWSKLAYAADTLVFLMGVEALEEIAARLQEHGRSPDTPVALVQWGTWPSQKVVTGTLATIVEERKKAGLTPPAVCVVGEVVNLREKLRWFDDPVTRPLFGRRIVVTRAREQMGVLSEMLRARGAEPVEFPVIRIEPISDPALLDAALLRLQEYAWVVFTSANTPAVLAGRMENLGLDGRAFAGVKVAAIGPATASAVRKSLGIKADFVPSEAVAEAAASEWPDKDLTGRRVLLPRAAEAREILPESLRALGAEVDVLSAYETTSDPASAESLRDALEHGSIDAITFTASSTVRNFVRALSVEEDKPITPIELRGLLGETVLAAIGPITAQSLVEYGLPPHVVAPVHTMPGLAAALEAHFTGSGLEEGVQR